MGPTTRLSEYLRVTGSEPESSTVLRLWASLSVNLPVMETSPPVILLWTAGADFTTPSSTMAMRPFVGASSPVTSANFLLPVPSSLMLTA